MSDIEHVTQKVKGAFYFGLPATWEHDEPVSVFLTNWAIGLAKTGEASFARICLTLHETVRLRELLVYWMAPSLEWRPGASR